MSSSAFCFFLSITHGLTTYFDYPLNWCKPLFNSPGRNTNYVPPIPSLSQSLESPEPPTPTTSPSSSPAPETSPPPSPSSRSGGDQSLTPAPTPQAGAPPKSPHPPSNPNPSPPSSGAPCPFPGGLPPLGDGDLSEAIPDMVYTVVKMAFQMVECRCGGCAVPNPSPPATALLQVPLHPPGGSPSTPTPSLDSPVTSPVISPSPDTPPTSPTSVHPQILW